MAKAKAIPWWEDDTPLDLSKPEDKALFVKYLKDVLKNLRALRKSHSKLVKDLADVASRCEEDEKRQ